MSFIPRIPPGRQRRLHTTLPDNSRRGFALLITITLVAFLVLILVSLATLTRVETQVAANSQQQAQARQNALLALNIALGELQKYTGPDQRTTARSDMDAALANTTTASGRWLGAYGGGAPADYDQAPSAVSAAIVAASDNRGSQARLLNWLVSGNEGTAFNPATDVGATGNITTPPTQFQFTPAGNVAGLVAGVNALDTDLTVADRNNAPRPARLLVGPGTVGDSLADHVVAPLREISAEAPGMGTTPVAIGRYAWWVGDEGAKARVNLPMATPAQAPNAFVSAQRAAIELMDGVNPSATTTLAAADMLDPTGANSLYNPAASGLSKLLSTDQLPMLAPAASGTLSTTAKYRYHDLSPWSQSILSDTYAGGLKKDLSALLADIGSPHASPYADTDFIFRPQPQSGSFTSNEFGVPTWGQLRSFARQSVPSTNAISVSAPKMVTVSGRATPTVVETSVAPVMSYATIGFSYGVRVSAPMEPDPTLPGNPLTVDLPGTPIRLAAFPMVVLWNPYSFDLEEGLYEVGFRKRSNGAFELQAAPEGTTEWNSSHVLERNTLNGYFGSADPYIRFLVETPMIPAGQSLVFTLNTSDIEFQQGAYSCRLTHGYRRLNHVLMPRIGTMPQPSASPEITTPHQVYRVGVNGASSAWFAGAVRTYFGGTEKNFGNSDYSHAYLRLISSTLSPLPALPVTTYPDTYNPYDTTATDPGLDVLQWLGEFRPEGQYGAAPYGQSRGYARHRDTTSPYNTLLQNEGSIGMISEPTFWLPFSMRFANADTRWLAVANPRALFTSSPPAPSGSSAKEPPNWLASPSNDNWPPGLSVSGSVSAPRANAGVALNTISSTPVDVSLFELRATDQPLLSIGQFQHANLSLLADNPAYAVGNSPGNIYLPSPAQLFRQMSGSGYAGPTSKTTTVYDSAWLLNRALWDRHFLSTIPRETEIADIPDELANPRLRRHGDPTDVALRDATQAASGLILEGGFNINSTSEQAWRAVLAGVNRLAYNPVSGGASSGELGAALSRFSKPLSAPPPTLDNTTVWTGYRELDESQIAQLAASIVAEIRSRGPSVSLADFINRRLVGDGTFPQANDRRLAGVLQAAIETTVSLAAPVNSASSPAYSKLVPVPPSWSGSLNPYKSGAGSDGAATAQGPTSSTSAFAPQYLTQGDILSAIGAGLAARSDTFTIRTYGEVLNPAASSSSTDQITSQAWCEAVVQRLPDYIDTQADPDAHLSPTNDTNRHMGRRYKILSFRWLSPSDI